jgi:dihydropteroate synthase
MGIVNVTPDSFSDGGKFFQTDKAVNHALRLVDAGAEILDIGGESTRPYSSPISLQEELDRVVPVVSEVSKRSGIVLSIDTSKAAVARECLKYGVEIINDVTGCSGDPEMVPLVAESRAGLCVMHMQGTPQTMQDCPTYEDVVEDILQYLSQRRDDLVAAGIERRRICLDPGIGFGKTHQHNLTLLCGVDRFHTLECPLLVGHSRKGFIAKMLGGETVGSAAGSLGVALAMAARGVQVIRLHDVEIASEALLLFEASGGLDI